MSEIRHRDQMLPVGHPTDSRGTNLLRKRQRLETIRVAQRQAFRNWDTLTSAQKDAAARRAVQASALLADIELDRFEEDDA